MPPVAPKQPSPQAPSARNANASQIIDHTERLEQPEQAGQHQAFQFAFGEALIRAAMNGDKPIFMNADVCRALGLAANNGSYRHHLTKLAPTQKFLVHVSAFAADPYRFNVEGRQHPQKTDNDSGPAVYVEQTEDGSTVWAMSESGLYTLIMRSRGATKPGTTANRFLCWVTEEVLPAIRRTGSYTTEQASKLEGPDMLTLNIRDPARYVVMVFPDQPAPHIRKTRLDVLLDEWSAFDAEILANQIRTVDAIWQKTQLVRSIGDDPFGTKLYDRLSDSIAECRRLADEYVRAIHSQPA